MTQIAQPLKLESGIPIPATLKGSGVTGALRALENAPVGTSVLIPGKKPARLGAFFENSGHGHGWYVCRAEGDGARVWKLREPSKAA